MANDNQKIEDASDKGNKENGPDITNEDEVANQDDFKNSESKSKDDKAIMKKDAPDNHEIDSSSEDKIEKHSKVEDPINQSSDTDIQNKETSELVTMETQDFSCRTTDIIDKIYEKQMTLVKPSQSNDSDSDLVYTDAYGGFKILRGKVRSFHG